LTNLFRNEMLEGEALPRRFVSYTPCFRSEAGSYGKDIRGLVRQHQFNKVEMMVFALPENSFAELEAMTAAAEEVLKRLGLAYRVVLLCTGDMGFASSKTYDLESGCRAVKATWRSRRARTAPISRPGGRASASAAVPRPSRNRTHPERFRAAVGRTVSAVLENYQQADGSVIVPPALRPYLDGLERIVTV